MSGSGIRLRLPDRFCGLVDLSFGRGTLVEGLPNAFILPPRLAQDRLRMAISEYVEHYHAERNHQGLENALIAPGLEVGELSGPVLRRERLGGMLSYYHRKAA